MTEQQRLQFAKMNQEEKAKYIQQQNMLYQQRIAQMS